MQAFVDREEEFDFTLAPYTDLKTGAKGKVSIDPPEALYYILL